MDMTEFEAKFQADPAFQTKVIADLSNELFTSGLDIDTIIETKNDGTLKSLIIDNKNPTSISNMAIASRAIKVLELQGVQDIGKIGTFDPKVDPLALNVVYKDGGWVLNT